MRIPRRAPREVYRLYGEHEYLAGAGAGAGAGALAGAGAPAGHAPSRPPHVPSLISRARLPILLGAVCAVTVAIVVLHARPHLRQPGRAAAARMRSADRLLAAAATPHAEVGPQRELPPQPQRKPQMAAWPEPQTAARLERKHERRRRLSPSSQTVAATRQATQAVVVDSAPPVFAVASQSTAPEDSPQPEFGFER